MKTNMTIHAYMDRMDRIEYIIDNIGLGKPICDTYVVRDDLPAHMTLTTTGIMIVRNLDDKIITVYIASMGQAKGVWEAKHGKDKKMPAPLRSKIRDNERYQFLD